jgi:hypothetical protein|tara:strand:- start:698 stop:1024 length:327 start_codon:yes stop_codon:yes gene_type:complete
MAVMKPNFKALLAVRVPLMATNKKPITKEQSAKIIEAEIRGGLFGSRGDLTKAQIDQLKKALLKCMIATTPRSNFTPRYKSPFGLASRPRYGDLHRRRNTIGEHFPQR